MLRKSTYFLKQIQRIRDQITLSLDSTDLFHIGIIYLITHASVKCYNQFMTNNINQTNST